MQRESACASWLARKSKDCDDELCTRRAVVCGRLRYAVHCRTTGTERTERSDCVCLCVNVFAHSTSLVIHSIHEPSPARQRLCLNLNTIKQNVVFVCRQDWLAGSQVARALLHMHIAVALRTHLHRAVCDAALVYGHN